ncbi:MAG: helicase C-terminal domain-containing protein [Planctomycetota bacterium]|jgi:ATP-dependent DNA helicase DinG|nr:helicase C-terminal domain-containing protein [Planctomycetota bacterium]
MHPSLAPIFVSCASTGSDRDRDGIYFLEACTYLEGDGPATLIPTTEASPFEPGCSPASAPKSLADIGFTGEHLASLQSWREIIPNRLAALEGKRIVVGEDASGFLQRFQLLCPGATPPVVIDLVGLAAFLHPRRGTAGFDTLFRHYCGTEANRPRRSADIRRLLEALVRAHFERDSSLRQLFTRGLDDLITESGGEDAQVWDWLLVVRDLLDYPSRYSGGEDQDLFFVGLNDDCLSQDLEDAPMDADRILLDCDPRFLEDFRRDLLETDVMSSRCEEEAALSPDGHKRLQAFFDLVPKHFAKPNQDPVDRPGQRALAQEVSAVLGSNQFLLADAPTGTGKTLAYLAPLMLWSLENHVRVGVSTYTRALQEQAFFREIPRALELLEAAGVPHAELPKVSLLKGRANYICGRAILDAAPEPSAASIVARATWLRLALFYSEDPTADLDGFPLSPGLPAGNPMRQTRTAQRMVSLVRSLPNCCRGRAANRCGAGIRSMRAERSHVVVTNHAFVLARPEEFSHIVFDECDHLHEVALSARSFDIELDEVTKLAADLRTARGRDRAPLPMLKRLLSKLAAGDRNERLSAASKEAEEFTAALDAAAHDNTRELRDFEKFRKDEQGARTREEAAFMLHEYLDSGRGDTLITSLTALRVAVDGLDSALRTVIEELGDVHLRQARKLRWALRRPLELLAHWREGLELWLGGESGEGDFSEDLHFEVEFTGRRRPLLVLKWLLPQQWLGEVYFPSLRDAALVSATAHMRGGFKAMSGYLGLDLLAEDSVERIGTTVNGFQGPPSFEATSSLYCVPEDAPPYAYRGPNAEQWMEYVEDLLVFLAERTRGRILGLFTNRVLLMRVGERLAPIFRAMGLPFYYQGMPGYRKEEIMELFRAQEESVLFGLDTFWYGVDFPGPTCQYVVMPKLPYGAPDNYMFAQQARMGWGPHRHRIYLPKAIAMFRQGCGRLLRNEDDRGGVIILDRRVLDERHAAFLEELPRGPEEWQFPEVIRSSTDECLQKLFSFMRLGADLERRGLDPSFLSSRGAVRYD